MPSPIATTRPLPHRGSVGLNAHRCGESLEKAFRPGDRVLEIGCGTGVDACFLAERGVKVLACDSSPQMIAVDHSQSQRNGERAFGAPSLAGCRRHRQLAKRRLVRRSILELRSTQLCSGSPATGQRLGDSTEARRDGFALLDGSMLFVGNHVVPRSGKTEQSVPAISSRRRRLRDWQRERAFASFTRRCDYSHTPSLLNFSSSPLKELAFLCRPAISKRGRIGFQAYSV